MKSKYFNPTCFVFCLIFCAVSGMALGAPKQSHTATALIKVLPYADTDPMVIGTPQIDREKQKEFRHSLAILMKQQNFLMKLIQRDKIRETEWFKYFGENQVIAIEDLQKNLNVTEPEETDFLEVAMTCSQPQEAALIVNEMVDMFVARQNDYQVEHVRRKLMELEQRRRSIEQNLDLAERALDDVRKSSGFSDLEERNYRHPVAERFIRLQETVDTLKLQRARLRASALVSDNNEVTPQIKKELMETEGVLEEAEQLFQQAALEKHRLDAARMQYQQRAAIRDQLREALGDIKKLIGKYRILAEDPDAGKIQKVDSAPVPLKLD
ncbi:MAG: hypothetical protein JW804_06095 [Sedimentisphaerales bacterium]|nr:hypothetical protein [Sedimentisphaerales bacterium]